MELIVYKDPKKRKIIIITAIIISIIILIILGLIIKPLITEEKGEREEEEIENLTAQFDQIFTNNLQTTDTNLQFKAKYEDKPIVFTRMEGNESQNNLYDINIHIPYINIDNKDIDKYNQEIETFINKTQSILETTSKNTIYTVEYVANVKDNILSLLIRTNLKEGKSAQRVIIQTYNYDIANQKEITLEEVLNLKDINKDKTQEKIQTKISEEQEKVKALKELGYNIYNRNLTNKMYNIENSKEFYITEDAIYIIYAYGNEDFTSEMDIVII